MPEQAHSSSWGRRLRPHGRDLARWAQFRRTIIARIEGVRRYEPECGSAFGMPLPDAAPPVRPLPVGRIAPLPANHHDREPNGRYRRAP